MAWICCKGYMSLLSWTSPFKQTLFHFQLTNANSGPVSRNPEDQEQMNTESVKLAIHFLFNTYYHVKWGGVDDGGGGGEDDDHLQPWGCP